MSNTIISINTATIYFVNSIPLIQGSKGPITGGTTVSIQLPSPPTIDTSNYDVSLQFLDRNRIYQFLLCKLNVTILTCKSPPILSIPLFLWQVKTDMYINGFRALSVFYFTYYSMILIIFLLFQMCQFLRVQTRYLLTDLLLQTIRYHSQVYFHSLPMLFRNWIIFIKITISKSNRAFIHSIWMKTFN